MSGFLPPCTVTLSPAIDLHLSLPSLAVGREQNARVIGRFAGGKGINVSTVLDSYGIENRALCLLGEQNGSEFRAFPHLPKNLLPFSVGGSVRENITLHSAEGETRISLADKIDPVSAKNACKALFDAIEPGNRFVAFCGSVPNGISEDFLIDRLRTVQKNGALLLCDSRSLSAAALKEILPYCIKPNEFEFSALCGGDEKEALSLARNVLLTNGGKDGLFLSEKRRFRLIPPHIAPVSTVGAGDSTLAGFIVGKMRGLAESEALRLALAFGSAACLTDGTAPPERKTADALFPKAAVEELP